MECVVGLFFIALFVLSPFVFLLLSVFDKTNLDF